ncbi:hypothetical protein OKW21_002098 [Catalinimonas alkaloidigena]|uniref:hypothetical protein n=1 Tax=Catalinimonas alkaloidigena TaxID=1075417 RepID=UPI002404CFF5|nr:hypothetical protein [Catalinimonas alkaloidigena]MDF9796835.1 hypothetical protein [Catalinimonas alkaloidigena]
MASVTYILFVSSVVQAQEQANIEKLGVERVNPADVKAAEDIADQILTKMAEGSYYEFKEGEAIPEIVQLFTKDTQKQAYQQIKAQVGEYLSSLEFQEAYSLSQGGMEATIFRFKGDFSKSEPEVRVVLDRDDKLAGLRVLPWTDQL